MKQTNAVIRQYTSAKDNVGTTKALVKRGCSACTKSPEKPGCDEKISSQEGLRNVPAWDEQNAWIFSSANVTLNGTARDTVNEFGR